MKIPPLLVLGVALLACGGKAIRRPAGVERATFELRFATLSADGPAVVEVSPKGARLALDTEVLVSESDIQSVGTDEDQFKLCSLQLFFSDAAGSRLREASANREGQMAAFIVDGRVLLAAVISSPLQNAVQIDTGLSCADAARLAERLAP